MKPNLVSFSEELSEVFNIEKTKEPRLSLRAFSSRIKISPAELSQLLKAKRFISRARVESIISNLPLNPSQKSDLTQKVFNNKVKDYAHIEENNSTYELIADPMCFAILQLMQTPSFEPMAAHISERLGITSLRANQLILYMKGLGIIEVVNGKLCRTIKPIRTSDDIASKALKQHHQKDLEKISECLQLPVETRDFSSLTVRLDPADMAKAKEILRRAQDEIEALGADKKPNDVYKVATYLFPMTTLN